LALSIVSIIGDRKRDDQAGDLVSEPAALRIGPRAHRAGGAEVEVLLLALGNAPQLEKMPDGSRRSGKHHVVHRSAELLLHALHRVEVQGEPVEASVRTDGPVERRLRRERRQCVAGLAEAREHVPRPLEGLARLADRPEHGVAQCERCAHPFPQRVPQQLVPLRCRAWQPGGARVEHLRRFRSEQRLQQIDPRDAVDHAVVILRHEREAIPVQAVDDPQLPERLPAIELLREDEPAQPLELSLVTRQRKSCVPDVILNVEVRVVDPDRVSFEGDVLDALTVSRDPVETGRHIFADPIDVEAALRPGERTRLEQERARHLQVGVHILHFEEDAILETEAIGLAHAVSHASKIAHRAGTGTQRRTRRVEPHITGTRRSPGSYSTSARLPRRPSPERSACGARA
jgi:hypothetical protein